MKKKFALIGRNISHSRSPEVYEQLLGEEVDYLLVDCEVPEQVPNLPELLSLRPRVSVTAPYKKLVYRRCDEADRGAETLEAVNAVKLKGGRVIGTNTDLPAFESIYRERFSGKVSEAIILGDGAMSRLAQTAFESAGLGFSVLSRKLGNLGLIEQKIEGAEGSPLLVNACSREYSLGFSSDKSLFIWDMNYQMPKHEEFAQAGGHHYQDGYELLIRQAQYALSFWNL